MCLLRCHNMALRQGSKHEKAGPPMISPFCHSNYYFSLIQQCAIFCANNLVLCYLLLGSCCWKLLINCLSFTVSLAQWIACSCGEQHLVLAEDASLHPLIGLKKQSDTSGHPQVLYGTASEGHRNRGVSRIYRILIHILWSTLHKEHKNIRRASTGTDQKPIQIYQRCQL